MYQSISFFEKINLYATLKEDLKRKENLILLQKTNSMGDLVLV